MWKKYGLFLLACILLLSFGNNVFSSKPRLLYSSQKKRPKWIVKPPKLKEDLYFVGTKTGSESLDEGKKSAVDGAVKEIVEFFGITAKTSYEEKASYFSTKILDQIQTKGEARIAGLDVEEMYYEEWQEEEGRKTYNVFVLIRYPKEELEKEKRRLIKEEERKRKEAQAMIKQGDKNAQKGEISDALGNYASALTLLDYVEGGQEMKSQVYNQAGAVLRKLGMEALDYEKEGDTVTGLKNSLRVKAFFKDKDNPEPLKHFPVEFQFKQGSGILDKKVFTDEKGIAESKVTRINRALEVNVVEAKLSQDILKEFEPSRVLFQFRSSGESVTILSREYSLNFGQGGTKETVLILMNKEQAALLTIDVSSPGRFEEIRFQLDPLEKESQLYLEPDYKVDISGVLFPSAKNETVKFSAEECETDKTWTASLPPLKMAVRVKDFFIKDFTNPYTGTFTGFSRLNLEVGIFYD